MVSNNYTLTKTKILSGLQCQKKLWYDFHEPVVNDNSRARLGIRFEQVVKKKDEKIPFLDQQRSINIETLNKKKTVIFKPFRSTEKEKVLFDELTKIEEELQNNINQKEKANLMELILNATKTQHT